MSSSAGCAPRAGGKQPDSDTGRRYRAPTIRRPGSQVDPGRLIFGGPLGAEQTLLRRTGFGGLIAGDKVADRRRVEAAIRENGAEMTQAQVQGRAVQMHIGVAQRMGRQDTGDPLLYPPEHMGDKLLDKSWGIRQPV